MTPRDRGLLLLTCRLGDPRRPVLTAGQYWGLGRLIRQAGPPGGGAVDAAYLAGLGYVPAFARQVTALLSQEDRLDHYLARGERLGYVCITRLDPRYPRRLRILGEAAPACLWAWGQLSLLDGPCVSLVGSRDIGAYNADFAAKVGLEAARQGYALVTGGARGADRAALAACWRAGGRVVTILPDGFSGHRLAERTLFLSEDSYDLPFSSARALRRNHAIHALGQATLVAQCTQGRGGTWAGATANLNGHWSPLWALEDQTQAMKALLALGAKPITLEDLGNLSRLTET